MAKHRTLKLTHEQIDVITEALGVAEGAYVDMHKQIIQTLVRNRGNNNAKEEEAIAGYYHKKACIFADLNSDISQSELDV